MFYPPELTDFLKSLAAEPLVAVVYRHMFGDHKPSKANTLGARWNPPSTAAIYASLEPETALAEAEYQLSLNTPRIKIRRTLFTIKVKLGNVIDLRSPTVLDVLKLPEDLSLAERQLCERIGGAAAWLRRDGILVPSARRLPGTNLVIYPDQQDLTVAEFEVIDQTVI